MSLQLYEYKIEEFEVPILGKKIVTYGACNRYKTFVLGLEANYILELDTYDSKKCAIAGHYKWCRLYSESAAIVADDQTIYSPSTMRIN